ncbi:MAG: FG-GAP repeat domain-containing protein [Planctomycetota bacterium]
MRLVKTITTIILWGAIFCNASLVDVGVNDVNIGQAAPNDINDITAYYGFDEMEIIKLNFGINGLRLVDFNNDGRVDIAVVNNRKAKIEILIQKETIGPGEESIAVDPEDVDVNIIIEPTRFKKESVPVSEEVRSLVCGDLNSDGMTDLAFYGAPKGLYVILQRSGEAEEAETLRWRIRKKINIDDGLLTLKALLCADLNNDGADDLALASRDGVYIVFQKEDGSLAEPVKYASAAGILGIRTGDLNGDNINDLVLVTNDKEKPIHIRFGLETGQLGPEILFFIEKPLLWAFELHNIDGIAGDEILTIDERSKRLICYKLSGEKLKDTDWPILLYPLASGEGETNRDLVVADFDGNSLNDIVISDPGAAELIFYKQTAGFGLAEPVRFPAFADIRSLSAADIDGDGKTELGVLSVKEKVIGLSKFEGDRLSFPEPLDLFGEPLAMELADVDGDSSIDCTYISKDVNNVRKLRFIYNLGGTGKPTAGLFEGDIHTEILEMIDVDGGLELKELTSNPDGIKVIDVDQDGLQDVLIFVKYELPLLVRQAQLKKFALVDSTGAQVSLIKDASLRSIAVADVDETVGEELLVAQKNFARSLVFADSRKWSVIDQYNAESTENNITAVAVFKLDALGEAEKPAIILLDGQKGQLQILTAGDDKTYRFEKELDVGKWNAVDHLKMEFSPLTGGQEKSILLFDGARFALITPAGGSNIPQHLEQQFSYETKIKEGLYGNLTSGDINSDGRADITMVEYNHNHIEILALDWERKPIPAMRFKLFEQKRYRDRKRPAKPNVEPRELKVADVTGDGKGDLVTLIHDRIIIYPQD